MRVTSADRRAGETGASILRARLAVRVWSWTDRVEHYRFIFGLRFPGSVPTLRLAESGRETIAGIWCFGQDYRTKSKYYGGYPGNYVERLQALFPDHAIAPESSARGTRVLHAFSGSLPAGAYDRCDLLQDSELRADVCDLPTLVATPYDFVAADTPYGKADAARYGTAMVNKKRALAALAEVTRAGGHIAWLDTEWPMHSKTKIVIVGQIFIRRSTQHRLRLLSIFERV